MKALRHVQLGGAGRKPWSLHKDGDLWEMLFDIAHSCGFTSFSTQWTKGHVTLRFLASGSGLARDGIYNSLADRAASKGYDLQHSRCAHALFSYFGEKQKRSIHVFRCVCKRIARVAQAASDKLELIKHSETLGRNISFIDAPAVPTHEAQGRIQLGFEALPRMPTTRKPKPRFVSSGSDSTSYLWWTSRPRSEPRGSSYSFDFTCAGATQSRTRRPLSSTSETRMRDVTANFSDDQRHYSRSRPRMLSRCSKQTW